LVSHVRLVGVDISFEKNFYQLPFTPPLSGRQFGPSSGIRADYGSFGTLTSLRSQDGIPGTGIGSSALRWEDLPDVVEADGCVPLRQGIDPFGRYSEHNLCSSDQLSCSRIEGHA
jgi:hypothetical protein